MPDTVIYFIQSSATGAIKIGSTSRLINTRLNELQTSQEAKLVLLGTTTKYSERDLHIRFDSIRLEGE